MRHEHVCRKAAIGHKAQPLLEAQLVLAVHSARGALATADEWIHNNTAQRPPPLWRTTQPQL